MYFLRIRRTIDYIKKKIIMCELIIISSGDARSTFRESQRDWSCQLGSLLLRDIHIHKNCCTSFDSVGVRRQEVFVGDYGADWLDWDPLQLALVTDMWTRGHTSVTQLQRDQLHCKGVPSPIRHVQSEYITKPKYNLKLILIFPSKFTFKIKK